MNKNVELVLVHGLLGSLDFFNPAKYLPSVKVLCPDLYGYGQTDLKSELRIQDQVDFLKLYIEEKSSRPCWLLGHSVGGAIVNIFASQNPAMVEGIINVEGNFTINDAFMCQSIASKSYEEWEVDYGRLLNNPKKWLEGLSITPTQERILWAEDILAYQDAKTVKAVAQAVVDGTASEDYKAVVDLVFAGNIPIYLLAGSYSINDWDIPETIRDSDVTLSVMKSCGHMMMLEKPEEFCEQIKRFIYRS